MRGFELKTIVPPPHELPTGSDIALRCPRPERAWPAARLGQLEPSSDAALDDGDGAARHPYSIQVFKARNFVSEHSLPVLPSRGEGVVTASPNQVDPCPFVIEDFF